jgi:hypothetical protein
MGFGPYKGIKIKHNKNLREEFESAIPGFEFPKPYREVRKSERERERRVSFNDNISKFV